jgi:hypothetical protein
MAIGHDFGAFCDQFFGQGDFVILENSGLVKHK